jgi:hypothetical protein
VEEVEKARAVDRRCLAGLRRAWLWPCFPLPGPGFPHGFGARLWRTRRTSLDGDGIARFLRDVRVPQTAFLKAGTCPEERGLRLRTGFPLFRRERLLLLGTELSLSSSQQYSHRWRSGQKLEDGPVLHDRTVISADDLSPRRGPHVTRMKRNHRGSSGLLGRWCTVWQTTGRSRSCR